MKYRTLNLKEYMPTVEQALAMIEIEIERCRKEGVLVLKVIHGYGSTGVGGEIKKALQNWSKIAKKRKVFSNFVRGEQWVSDSDIIKDIKQKCPEVMGDMELYHSNPGVSLILI